MDTSVNHKGIYGPRKTKTQLQDRVANTVMDLNEIQSGFELDSLKMNGFQLGPVVDLRLGGGVLS